MNKLGKAQFFRAVSPFMLLALASCSSTKTYEVTFTQDVFVSDSQKDSQLVSKGSSMLLNSQNYTLIEAPGHLSILVPPSDRLPESLKVSLKPVSSWGQELVKKQMDEKLTEIFQQVNEIQSLLGQKQGEKALSQLEKLERQYPGLLSVKYLKIHSLLVLNRKREARRELASAEEDFRQNETGRKLIKFFEKNHKSELFETLY